MFPRVPAILLQDSIIFLFGESPQLATFISLSKSPSFLVSKLNGEIKDYELEETNEAISLRNSAHMGIQSIVENKIRKATA